MLSYTYCEGGNTTKEKKEFRKFKFQLLLETVHRTKFFVWKGFHHIPISYEKKNTN